MKKLNMSQWVSLIVMFMMIVSCETIDETFEEFTKNGETIYIGKSDTVLLAPGYDKLRVWVAINSDPKISKGLMESNDGSVKHEFEVVRTTNGKEFLLVKSIITALKLQYDATEGCYGGNYGRLTDGSTAAYWHSCSVSADRYPWVMSFDLGVAANLSRFRLDERADCCGGRGPGAYQIWGTNDLTNAVTADIDAGTLVDWEADAVAKGWVKLLDVSGNEQATFEVNVPENASSFRYVRIVGISAIDGGASANFNEFTFWTK